MAENDRIFQVRFCVSHW